MHMRWYIYISYWYFIVRVPIDVSLKPTLGMAILRLHYVMPLVMRGFRMMKLPTFPDQDCPSKCVNSLRGHAFNTWLVVYLPLLKNMKVKWELLFPICSKPPTRYRFPSFSPIMPPNNACVITHNPIPDITGPSNALKVDCPPKNPRLHEHESQNHFLQVWQLVGVLGFWWGGKNEWHGRYCLKLLDMSGRKAQTPHHTQWESLWRFSL